MISENARLFLQGRKILDCSMIGNEVLHLLAVRKERALMFKIDFHKAFDSVSWVYLESVIFRMGFDLR